MSPAQDERAEDDGQTGEDGENDGTLLMDATCVPGAIRYPTDLSLLNDAQEMIDAIRPAPVEFGAKISTAKVGGFAYPDRLS